MGSRNGGFLPEERRDTTSLNDALLFTTMSIIGFPVDVHVKDGSIYSGTFHTASLEDAYAVVLKKARMIKKGNRVTNVADGRLIDTLVVLSEDLVQVVAKEVLLPAEGVSGKVRTADVGVTDGIVPQNVCEEREANAVIPKEPKLDKKHINHKRCFNPSKKIFPKGSAHENSLEIAKGESDSRNLIKRREASTISSAGRQVGESSEDKHGEEPILQGEQTTDKVEGSRTSLDACGIRLHAAENINAGINKEETPSLVSTERSTMAKLDGTSCEQHTVEEAQLSIALSSTVPADATSLVDVASDSSLTSSSASMKVVLPEVVNHGLTAKESKLNPRAKLFSPSPLQHRSATPPTVPSPPSMTPTPEPSPVVPTEPEVEASSFAFRSSVPAKFLQHNNLFLGNGRGDLHYVQPVVGHVGSRTQPVRYAALYNNLQAGPVYLHPNSEMVMAGQPGPLFYVHPISNDVTLSRAGFPQLSSRPLLMPHQVNHPKHQGTATVQALQLYVAPSFLANGHQPFAVPSYIPNSHPLFPVVGSVPDPESEGSLSAKFA
ncbi:hypothetical protein ACH5RR_037951 [Cinchona calisaya]|uniref:Ataxin 2 SM domain-containing protein n=1 Tax=Cinchona calisaya TaxID=153742 RepID=A0ABD2Y7Q1_9GENT